MNQSIPMIEERTTTGLDPKLAAVLSYLAWWVTGILFWILERENRFVRFHAMQSIIAFGAMSALVGVLSFASLVTLFISATGFQILWGLAELAWLAALIVWALCLFKAFAGERWKLPIAGAIAERKAEG